MDPPLIAMRSVLDQPELASHRAQAQKSSKTFCLFASFPASCQARPYSPPPRRLATASIPPRSSQTAQAALNDEVVQAPTPPYPYSSTGTSPRRGRPRRRVRNSGSTVPSAEVTSARSVVNTAGSSDTAEARISVVWPERRSWRYRRPDSVNDTTSKWTMSLSGVPVISSCPTALPPRVQSPGSGMSRTNVPSSSNTLNREQASRR